MHTNNSPVGQLNEKSVYEYELFVFNIDEIELFVFIGVENEQFVFNGIENAHLLYPLNSPFRINIWGGAECPLPVLSQTRIFGPPRPPPYRIDFAKNRKKSESTQNGLKRREIEKKIFAPWWPPPEKNLEKFSKIFLKIFWKLFRIIWNVKKTRKIFFHFFSVIPKKNLEKFSNFFFENFSKVVQNHLKREKNSKKFFSFFPYFGLG